MSANSDIFKPPVTHDELEQAMQAFLNKGGTISKLAEQEEDSDALTIEDDNLLIKMKSKYAA